jgi:hypothetical protein
MKRFFTTILALFFISYAHYAQQTPTDDKQIFRANDDKLYINRETGIYLWISTSPDPNSEKIQLKSDSSKKYSNPMYLDTEGYNSIRHKSAVNPVTKEIIFPLTDVIFGVYADGLNPVSSVDFNSGSVKKLNGKKYFGGDLRIALHSADATSGVSTLQYKLNGSSFSEYKEPLIAFNEGENTLEYFSVDKVGNKENVNTDIFYIDNTPPTTSYEIEGNRSDKYVSANAEIKLSAVDVISGVKSTFYRINKGPFIRYSAPIPVSVFTNDETSLTYFSEDNLGNKETQKTIGGKDNSIQVEGNSAQNMLFEFYIDREPPVISINVDTDEYKGKYTYVSIRSKFTIISEDQKSGVDKVLFSVNNPLVENPYKEPFMLNKDGLQTIRVKSNDYVGNTAPLLTRNYFIDTKPPVTRINVGSPKFLSHDTLFITDRTPVQLTAADDQSGVSQLKYSLEKGKIDIYSKPFSVSVAGAKTIEYLAIDNVNNTESIKEQIVYVDILPPEIIYHFSVESIGTKNVREEAYTIYPTNTMLYIAATDARSGGEKIEYSINGSPMLNENPVKSFASGNYIIKVNAYDVLANKSTREIKFAIEK